MKNDSPPPKVPRMGWIVGATALGALLGRGIGLAFGSEDGGQMTAFCSLLVAVIGALIAILVEAVIFKCRFTVSHLLELFVVCAILMWLWHMYDSHVAANNLQRSLNPSLPNGYI
jgi:hypothetical protein